MEKILMRSMQTGQKLEVIYLSNENQVSQRFIRVIKLNGDMVMAYCYSKRKVRTFKLDNILSVGPLPKRMGA